MCASGVRSRPLPSIRCNSTGFEGGLSLERIAEFKAAGSRVDTYAVGSAISGVRPIDFTADIHEIDGQPIGKRGRPSGTTTSPRLREVDLAAWRAALTPATR